MIGNLNNTNGKGSNAVVNKQIKDLQDAVSQLQDSMSQVVTDLVAVDADLDNKVDKNELASEVDTASVKANNLKVDTIESKDEESIQISDDVDIAGNVSAGEASFTKVNVNGVDIVEDLNGKVSCARTDAADAVAKADDAICCVSCTQSELDSYKAAQALETNTAQANIGTANVTHSLSAESLTVASCAEINDLTAQVVRAKAELMDAFIEPTEKDATDFYQFHLPAGFNGKARFVGTDENGGILFSAVIDTAFSSTSSNDREGTALVIHSGLTKYDFFQVLRRRDIDQISFITQSNIKRLSYSYENYDKDDEPQYDIWPNLTDKGPDYTSYNTKYEAEHSDQVVVLGNEDTLNGGLTIFGTFYATAFEVPETEVANVRVKHQIYGGYDCDTGEYETCGTPGGVITYNQRSSSGECNVSWINGCPRQVVRKGVCYDKDGYDNECSYLQFETVKTKDSVSGTFEPSDTDSLFDEAGLASYEGKTSVAGNPYPIKHLNCDTCVHGDITVEGKVVTNCIESATGCDLNITAQKDLNKTVCGNSSEHIVGDRTNCYEGTEISVHDGAVDRRYSCGKSETISAGDYTLCAQGGNVSVTACCDVGFTSDTHNIYANETTITCQTNIDKLKVSCVNGPLNVDGDIRTKGQVIADGDIVTHGNLFVDGAITATEETQVATKGDYLVTRESNGAAMATTDYSGVAVNNYDGNGSIATITADYTGEWRISDTANGAVTHYADISNFANVWYDALTRTAITGPEGVLSNIDLRELANTVYNATSGTGTVVGYYHKSGSDWYGPVSVVNGEFDLGSLVLDAADIATLNALTASDLVYYNTVDSTVIDASQNQPLLTRDEKTNLEDNDIFVWDAANKKAVSMVRPTASNQTISSCIDPVTNCMSWCWVTATTFDNIYPVGTVYMNYCTTTIPFSQGTWCPLNDTFLRATTTQSCVSCTGGSDTVTLETCHLPAHCHTGPSHCHCVSIYTGGAINESSTAGVEMCHAHSTTIRLNCSNWGGSSSSTGGIDRSQNNNQSCGSLTYTSSYSNLRHRHLVSGNTGASGTGNTGSVGEGCSFDIKPAYTNVAVWYRES